MNNPAPNSNNPAPNSNNPAPNFPSPRRLARALVSKRLSPATLPAAFCVALSVLAFAFNDAGAQTRPTTTTTTGPETLTGPGVVSTPRVAPTPPGTCPAARRGHAKPERTRYREGLYRDRVVFKLHDDSNLEAVVAARVPFFRARPVGLAPAPPAGGPAPAARADLGRAGLSGPLLLGLVNRAQLNDLNGKIARSRPLALRPRFSTHPRRLQRLRAIGEDRVCRRLAHLEQYYVLYLQDRDKGEEVADLLNGSPLVEVAFLPPVPRDADNPPTTDNFQNRQGYLNRADDGGIDARYAWRLTGGRGEGMRVVDVESTWNVNHEDLRQPFWFSGVPGFNEIATALNIDTDDVDINSSHGTAVMGVLVGRDDGRGVTGIASAAEWGASSVVFGGPPGIYDASVADAVVKAVEQVKAGDVILIEQHAPGPDSGSVCNTNCTQFEFVPMEFYPASFDATETASAVGVIVVAAAGNGSVNLDDSAYEQRFDRRERDSGAILVGGSLTATRGPNGSSNSGKRVDVHAWGTGVMTTGYGVIRANGDDRNQFYTPSFSGTSSASPIVAGAVLSIQGVLKASGQGLLTPEQMRDLLVRTGAAQTNGLPGRPIGPMPDLRAALGEFASATASAGGGGGEPFRRWCPEGSALIGVRGRAGAFIDQLVGICDNVPGAATETSKAGGDGGTAFERRCVGGRVVVGLRGRAGGFVDSLELECADPDDDSPRRNVRRLEVAGGGGGSRFGPNRCPSDRIAIGFGGSAGWVIDRIQLLCATQ